MTRVSASKLRKDLFAYLDRVLAGETVVIERNKREVARLVPTRQLNWRDRMSTAPKLLVPPEELIEPIGDIWEEYA